MLVACQHFHRMKVVLTVLTLFCLAQFGFSHSGRTDSNGGHWCRATNTYHYHSQADSIVNILGSGKASARGKTKAEAYVNALSKVPKAATAGQVTYTGSEKSGTVTCHIKWTK